MCGRYQPVRHVHGATSHHLPDVALVRHVVVVRYMRCVLRYGDQWAAALDAVQHDPASCFARLLECDFRIAW